MSDIQKFSQSIALSNTRINVVKAGMGDPVVVLLSGHRTPLANWDKVLPGLANHCTVVAYDRPGTGASSPATAPQNGRVVAETLNELLTALALAPPPPIVLAAHSLGGLYANYYARRFSDNVRAVVLVESGHPQQAAQRQNSETGVMAKVSRLFQGSFRNDPNSEFNGVDDTVAQINDAGPFPDIPLVVVTGKKKMPFVPKAAFESHQRWQKELLGLSSRSTHVVADDSGHLPQLSEPNLVIDAVSSVL